MLGAGAKSGAWRWNAKALSVRVVPLDFQLTPWHALGTMNGGGTHDCLPRRFLWGIVFAGISSIPFVFLFANVFRGISSEKATGLGAVAGGLTEVYVTFGFILTFALPVASIVLLCRSFSREKQIRKLFSLLFIVWSSFMLLLYGLCGWFFFVQPPYLNGPR